MLVPATYLNATTNVTGHYNATGYNVTVVPVCSFFDRNRTFVSLSL
jgi:hypothetical protein